MKISFAEPFLPGSGTLVVGVLADRKLTPAAAELDGRTGGQLGRAVAASPRFKGNREDLLAIPSPPGLDLGRILLVGLGAADTLDALAFERLGGVVLAQLNQLGETAAALRLEPPEGAKLPAAEAAAELAYGALLRAYRFDRYRTKEKPEAKPSLQSLTVLTADADAAAQRFGRLETIAAGVYFTRDLVSEPANILTPESFAERCRALQADGVAVEVLDGKTLKQLGMGALLAVGQGSQHDSKVVVMQWRGAPADAGTAPVAFVGKGVTFDTGGISIKPAAGMEDMKWDMGGAGVVTGLMKVLAGRRAKVNAVGVIGLVENMPSGTAQRPGDIVTSLSGQTIEVLNTDAEGRLVLADCLWYTQDRFKPAFMVDLATLTGAIMIALGTEIAGLFANNDGLAERLTAAGKAVGEQLWRMPLGAPGETFDKEIDSDAADMKNIAGSRNAGSIIGAQFLQRFVNNVPWAHLDIAGVTWAKKDQPTVPKGATAFGVRLLDRLVAEYYET